MEQVAEAVARSLALTDAMDCLGMFGETQCLGG